PDHALYLFGLDGDPDLATALRIIQELAKAARKPRPKLWLVTRGTQPVGSAGPTPSPMPALLWGLGRTLAQEHPDLLGRAIDLAPDSDLESDAAALERELLLPDGEPEIAIREQRYAPRLVEQPFLPRAIELRADATYLITGALGALGLLVAKA